MCEFHVVFLALCLFLRIFAIVGFLYFAKLGFKSILHLKLSLGFMICMLYWKWVYILRLILGCSRKFWKKVEIFVGSEGCLEKGVWRGNVGKWREGNTVFSIVRRWRVSGLVVFKLILLQLLVVLMGVGNEGFIILNWIFKDEGLGCVIRMQFKWSGVLRRKTKAIVRNSNKILKNACKEG